MAVEATKSSTKPTIQATGTGKAPGRGANCSENVALSAVPPEPVSASLPDTADEDAGDEEEEDTPLTPPTSEAKGPAASRQAPAKKVSAKSASALKPATQAKQAPKRVKKGVTGAKNEGVKADGRPANNMKGNGKARSDSANAKANPAQVDAAKQGAPPKVEGQEHLIMDPAYVIFVCTCQPSLLSP